MIFGREKKNETAGRQAVKIKKKHAQTNAGKENDKSSTVAAASAKNKKDTDDEASAARYFTQLS